MFPASEPMRLRFLVILKLNEFKMRVLKQKGKKIIVFSSSRVKPALVGQ